MQILRNVFRRKLRVLLTIFGITIGVLALVVMGSMAEKINLLVSGGTRYYSDKVTVAAEGSASVFATGRCRSASDRDQGRPGRGRGVGRHATLLDTEAGASFGVPAMIQGSDMRGDEYETFQSATQTGEP